MRRRGRVRRRAAGPRRGAAFGCRPPDRGAGSRRGADRRPTSEDRRQAGLLDRVAPSAGWHAPPGGTRPMPGDFRGRGLRPGGGPGDAGGGPPGGVAGWAHVGRGGGVQACVGAGCAAGVGGGRGRSRLGPLRRHAGRRSRDGTRTRGRLRGRDRLGGVERCRLRAVSPRVDRRPARLADALALPHERVAVWARSRHVGLALGLLAMSTARASTRGADLVCRKSCVHPAVRPRCATRAGPEALGLGRRRRAERPVDPRLRLTLNVRRPVAAGRPPVRLDAQRSPPGGAWRRSRSAEHERRRAS